MIIGNRIKSDHSPIEMRVQWKEVMGRQERTRKGVGGKRSIIKWKEGGVKEFRERLEAYGRTMSWEELKVKVGAAIPRVEVRGRRKNFYEEKWWDEDCHRKKEELNKALGNLRRGEINEEEWRKTRREYRNFLVSKKRIKGKIWLAEIEGDKEMKLF